MRPAPIDDNDMWPGAVRRVIAGPDGDLTGDIQAVEAIVDADQVGTRLCIKVGADEADRVSLERSGHFWLVIHG